MVIKFLPLILHSHTHTHTHTRTHPFSSDFGSGGQARHTLHTYFDDNGMADGTLAMHFGILDVFRVRAPPAADVSGDNAAGDEAC